MKFKIFSARTRKQLESLVSQWLESNPVTPDSMQFEYSETYLQDPDEHIIDHTLVLFYVPMMPLR